MRIIAKRTLREFWQRHPDAKVPLETWYEQTAKAEWETPAQVVQESPRASIISATRVVFRIKGNDYRLVVDIFYPGRRIYIRFIGTHAEYDRIDAAEV